MSDIERNALRPELRPYDTSRAPYAMTAPNVLIVEDDPALRTLVMRALQQNGFNVRTAGSAPEMWNVMGEVPVDVVILDIMLPGTHGLDLCRQIRQQSDVPLIFVSAVSRTAGFTPT